MKPELDVYTGKVVLKSLNESFMRYARIITVDEKDNDNVHYLKTILNGMKDIQEATDTTIDILECQYGIKGSFSNFRVPMYILKQAEKTISEKERRNV